MRFVLLSAFALCAVVACDELNRPMAVPTGGSSASSAGAAAAPADAGDSDAALPPLPGDQPRVQPQPGDVQL